MARTTLPSVKSLALATAPGAKARAALRGQLALLVNDVLASAHPLASVYRVDLGRTFRNPHAPAGQLARAAAHLRALRTVRGARDGVHVHDDGAATLNLSAETMATLPETALAALRLLTDVIDGRTVDPQLAPARRAVDRNAPTLTSIGVVRRAM
jgi:hypothetical protein